MDMVDTIQSPLIAAMYYERKDGLSINVLDTNDGPLGGVRAIRNGRLRAGQPSHP